MLTTVELHAMRTACIATMADTARIYRQAPTPDGMGGSTSSAVEAGAYPCRVLDRMLREVEREMGGRPGASARIYVNLAWNAVVEPGDLLVITGPNRSQVTYMCVEANNPTDAISIQAQVQIAN